MATTPTRRQKASSYAKAWLVDGNWPALDKAVVKRGVWLDQLNADGGQAKALTDAAVGTRGMGAALAFLEWVHVERAQLGKPTNGPTIKTWMEAKGEARVTTSWSGLGGGKVTYADTMWLDERGQLARVRPGDMQSTVDYQAQALGFAQDWLVSQDWAALDKAVPSRCRWVEQLSSDAGLARMVEEAAAGAKGLGDAGAHIACVIQSQNSRMLSHPGSMLQGWARSSWSGATRSAASTVGRSTARQSCITMRRAARQPCAQSIPGFWQGVSLTPRGACLRPGWRT